ncbi:MAG: hypothetical protein ACK4IY_04830 [Chitinophagales bacterium]
MKKYLLPITLSIIPVLTLVGCEQCTTCSYAYTVNGNPATYSENFCGSKSEVAEYESDFKSDAAAVMADAECIRE